MVKPSHENPIMKPNLVCSRNSDRTPASCRVRSKLSSTSRDFNLGPEINSRNSSQKAFRLQLSCHLLRDVLCLCLRQRSKHAPFSLRVLAASWATPQSRKSEASSSRPKTLPTVWVSNVAARLALLSFCWSNLQSSHMSRSSACAQSSNANMSVSLDKPNEPTVAVVSTVSL